MRAILYILFAILLSSCSSTSTSSRQAGLEVKLNQCRPIHGYQYTYIKQHPNKTYNDYESKYKSLEQTDLYLALKRNYRNGSNLAEIKREIAKYKGELEDFLPAAIEYDQYEAINLILNAGTTPNYFHGTFEKSALMTAIISLKINATQALLDHGASTKIYGDCWTALDYVKITQETELKKARRYSLGNIQEKSLAKVFYGNVEKLEEIERILVASTNKSEKLHASIRMNNVLSLRDFIERSREINLSDWRGNSPLQTAANWQNYESLLLLLNENTSWTENQLNVALAETISNRSGFSNIELNTRELAEIYKGVWPHWKFYVEQIAKQQLNTDPVPLLRALADLRANWGTIDEWENPKSHLSNLKIFLNSYIYVQNDSEVNKNSLYYKVVKAFLESGANPNINILGESKPMHIFAGSKNIPMLNLFLKYDGDLNAINEYGETPLFNAYPFLAESGSERLSQRTLDFLISNGAEANIKNKYGQLAEQSFYSKSELFFDGLEEAEKSYNLQVAQNRKRLIEKEESNKNSFNWAKALASTVGFVVGNGLKLPAEEQARILMGIVQDGFSGDESISNAMRAANQMTANANQYSNSQNSSQFSNQAGNNTNLNGCWRNSNVDEWCFNGATGRYIQYSINGNPGVLTISFDYRQEGQTIHSKQTYIELRDCAGCAEPNKSESLNKPWENASFTINGNVLRLGSKQYVKQ